MVQFCTYRGRTPVLAFKLNHRYGATGLLSYLEISTAGYSPPMEGAPFMSEHSPTLSLPLIQAAQAQKHVTHNEAVELLDMIVQLTVQDFDANTPPALALEAQVWAVGEPPRGLGPDRQGSLPVGAVAGGCLWRRRSAGRLGV